jgi:hypothetical protein
MKRLAEEIGVSRSSARTAIQFLKLRPYKTTVIQGFGRKWSWPDQGTIPAAAWEDQAKTRKASVRISEVPNELQTKHLLNRS